MVHQTSPYRAAEIDRNCVADQTTYRLCGDWLARLYETVFFGKTLKHRSFAKGDGAILFRVAESAIAESVILRGHGGGGIIPFHAAIHTGIGPSLWFPMAFGDQSFVPIAPSSSRLGGANPLDIQG